VRIRASPLPPPPPLRSWWQVLSVGLSNLASGFTGGIPATAALARTALNIKSGATSRAAGIINGLCIMLLSTVLFGLFKFLPLPVVAAILVNVAARMVEWPEVRLLYKMDKPMFAVAIVSALVCIAEDPTVGIIVGAFLGMIRLLMQLRNAHSLLRIYDGPDCKLNFLFEGVDVAKPVRLCRLKYTQEKTAADVAAEAAAAAANPLAVMTRVEASLDTPALTARATADRAGLTPVATPGVGSILPRASEEGAAEVEAARARKAARAARKAAKRAAAAAAAGPHNVIDADAFHLSHDPRDKALPTLALYMLPGYFSFVSAQAHRDRIRALFMAGDASLPGIKAVVFSLSETYFADPDALETIGSLQEELRRHGYEVFLLGFHARVLTSISKAHWFAELRTFPEYPALLAFMRSQVTADGVYVPAPVPEHHGSDDHGHGHGHGHSHDGDASAPAAAAGASAGDGHSHPAGESSASTLPAAAASSTSIATATAVAGAGPANDRLGGTSTRRVAGQRGSGAVAHSADEWGNADAVGSSSAGTADAWGNAGSVPGALSGRV